MVDLVTKKKKKKFTTQKILSLIISCMHVCCFRNKKEITFMFASLKQMESYKRISMYI